MDGEVVMKECIGLLGRWFGHNYKARFTSTFRDGNITYTWSWELKHFKEHAYEGDVCSRCGDIVNTGD